MVQGAFLPRAVQYHAIQLQTEDQVDMVVALAAPIKVVLVLDSTVMDPMDRPIVEPLRVEAHSLPVASGEPETLVIPQLKEALAEVALEA